MAANQNFGSDTGLRAQASVNTLLGLTITSKAAPVQTVAVENNPAAAVATSAATSASSSKAAKATAATGKKGKNNVKRDGVLKWAKRVTDDY